MAEVDRGLSRGSRAATPLSVNRQAVSRHSHAPAFSAALILVALIGIRAQTIAHPNQPVIASGKIVQRPGLPAIADTNTARSGLPGNSGGTSSASRPESISIPTKAAATRPIATPVDRPP